jgi:hypothetical protein
MRLKKLQSTHLTQGTDLKDVDLQSHIIVLDQGSRGSPSIASNAQVLLIDHHLSTQFPENAVVCSACNHLPVATTSLLTFIAIQPFLTDADPETVEQCQWLAVLGVKGDLGEWKWDPPFPASLHDHVTKSYTKKALSEAVSLLNARTSHTAPVSLIFVKPVEQQNVRLG